MKKRFSSIILVIAIIASSFMCFGTITASATGTVDITQDFTMTNLGQGISADTTTIGFVFGSHSSLPASGSGYYINDNPNSNGIDPLSFIEINGKNAREIVSENQNNVTSYTGTAFPMNIGGVYSPVLAFCEQGYIRISILHNYLPSGAYTITLKSGFTWNNNNGETLAITSDVTYAYDKDGNFSKVSNIVDTNSMLSIVNYLTNNEASEYSYIDIEATSDIFTGYDYKFLDTAFGSGGFLPYIEINGRTLTQLNATDISGYGISWTQFPASVAAQYRVPVLPVAESGGRVKLKLAKAWFDDFLEENGGELVVTIKEGFRSYINNTLYINREDKTYNFDGTSGWELVSENAPNPVEATKGNIVPTADYVNIGINLSNAGNLSAVGYHFSELKNDFPNVTTNIFVNGKSVSQINDEYDGSYTYTEFPATLGRAYQDPVYLQAENGLLWIKIAKPYFHTLPADFKVTLGNKLSYFIGGDEYKLYESVEFDVEKSGRDSAKWLSFNSSDNFGIGVFANSANPEGYQSFNLVYKSEVSGLAPIAYDSGNADYYAMQDKILICGKSVATINAETSTSGYAFNYFPASAIDSFKLPVIIFVSENNIELKINSAYYDTVKDDFSLVIKPDFFVIVNGVKYCMPDGFTYIANKEKRVPKLLGGTNDYVEIEMPSDFFQSAALGTVFNPVGGDSVMKIRESNNSISTFGALAIQKMSSTVYRINLLDKNVVDGATITLDAAYMNGTDIEHLGPAAFIYRGGEGWFNCLSTNSVGNIQSLVSNASFDSNISGWSLSNASDTASLTANGFKGNGIEITHSAVSGEISNTLNSASFSIEKGTTYRVYARVFANGKANLGAALMSGTSVVASSDAFTVIRDGSDGWKLMEYKFTSNINSSNASVRLMCEFNDVDSSVVFDDIIVCKDFYKGDVDANGLFDIRDLVNYKKVLAKSATFVDENVADLDEDGNCDAKDLIVLVKMLIGIDVDGYTYTKMSNGTALFFGSSDSNLDTFLNDFYERNVGTNNSTALRPGEIGYADTAWKAWEAQSLLWYDSTTTNFSSDKIKYMRDWLYGTPIDSYGYTWSSFNNLEDPTADPSGVFGMGWPFPNYGAQKDYDWEFNSNSKDGWSVSDAQSSSVSAGFFSASASNASEITFSKTSYSSFINTAESPFLEFDIRWALNSASVDDIVVSWKTSAISSSWKSVSVKDFSIMEQSFGKDYGEHIYLPMYLDSNWGNNKSIYGLKITVKAKNTASLTGSINLNYVRGNLDTRQIDNAYNFLETAKLYYEYTGDLNTLRDNLNRYRSAVMCMAYNLTDTDGLIDLSNFVGHDGGKRTDGRTHSIASSYWDLISLPKKSVYAQALYYKSLKNLEYLESVAQKNDIVVEGPVIRGFDNVDKTYNLSVQSLSSMANTVKTAVQQNVNTSTMTGYYDTAKGRFIDGFNSSGEVVDFGSTIFNNMVVSFGMATDEQAQSVLSWISGNRIIAGDNSTGSDIYAFDFAPRTTTVKNSTQYVADYSSAEANAAFGTYCQDGGAILYTSYYDIMSRIAYTGVNDAYARLSAIKDWYLDVLDAYNNSTGYDQRTFYRAYYANKGVTLQGGGTAGALGLDKEFIENTILISAISNGFFGLSGTSSDTLSVNPSLPDNLDFWRMENLMFHGVKYDLEIGDEYCILESVKGNNYGLKLNVNIKTAKANPKVFVNNVEIDSSEYTFANGVVSLTTNFTSKKIDIR